MKLSVDYMYVLAKIVKYFREWNCPEEYVLVKIGEYSNMPDGGIVRRNMSGRI